MFAPVLSCAPPQVVNGSKLGDAKLVDIPATKLNMPYLGHHDREYISFICKHRGEPGSACTARQLCGLLLPRPRRLRAAGKQLPQMVHPASQPWPLPLCPCHAHADEVDFVTLPYVQGAEDVVQVRRLLDEHGGSKIQVRSP